MNKIEWKSVLLACVITVAVHFVLEFALSRGLLRVDRFFISSLGTALIAIAAGAAMARKGKLSHGFITLGVYHLIDLVLRWNGITLA